MRTGGELADLGTALTHHGYCLVMPQAESYCKSLEKRIAALEALQESKQESAQ